MSKENMRERLKQLSEEFLDLQIEAIESGNVIDVEVELVETEKSGPIPTMKFVLANPKNL